MPTNNRRNDPIRTQARKAAAARRIGAGATCGICGEARPMALVAGRTPMICAECDRKQKGRAAFDNHHVAGKTNSPITVPVSVNDHRAELSEAQREWPKATLHNVDGSPVLAAAAWIRGIVDQVVYLFEKGLLCAMEMLEKLDTFLRDKLGRYWWRGTPLERFAPKQE